MFERRRYLAIAVALASLVPSSAIATPEESSPGATHHTEASSPASEDVQIGETPVIIIEGRVGTKPITSSTAVMPAFYFQSPLLDAESIGENADAIGVTIVKEQNAFLLHPLPTLARNEIVDVRAKAMDYHAYFKVGGAPEGSTVPPAYIVRHRPEQDALNALVEARTTDREETLASDAEARAVRAAEEHLIKQLRQQDNLLPVDGKVKRSTGGTKLDVPGATWMANQLYAVVDIDIDNDTHQPFLPASIRIEDGSGKTYNAEIVDFGTYATPDQDHLALIPGDHTARAIIRIADATRGQFASTRIEIARAGGLPAAWVKVEEWQHTNPFMRPKSSDQVEIERRDREAQGRVSLQPLAQAGFIWLSDGLGGEAVDATTLRGFGIRMNYGFNRYLAFEAEFAGAWSSNAEFDNVSSEGMDGALMRRATLGRAHIGGLLRFGYRFSPHVRAGVGLQAASHDAELIVEGSPTPGPGSSFDVNGLWYFGAGLDIRPGDSVSGGMAATFEQLVSDETRSLQAGIHLSYSWKP